MALGALGILGSACTGPTGQREFLSIGTGGTGGVYYPLGGALARSLSERDPYATYTAEVTGGSVENYNRLLAGEIDLAMVLSTTLFEKSMVVSDEQRRQVRVVAPLYPAVAHLMIARGSRANSPADFKGKRISVGAAGSGTEQFSRHLLAAYELDYEDVDERFLSFAESSAALRDGAIDAAIFAVGDPASSVLEATTVGGVHLISIDAEHIATLSSTRPYYFATNVPAGTYPTVDRPLSSVAIMNWLVALDSLEDHVAAALLDILVQEEDRLLQVNEIASQIDIESLARSPIALHAGTDRWLAER